MNEVRTLQTAVLPPVNSASSKGTTTADKTQESGKALPVDSPIQSESVAVPQAPKVSEETLLSEVEIVNDYVQNIQRDLQFSLDEDLDRTVIKVVDRDSGEVIRQIPDDIFLELARRLKDDGEFNLLNALG